MSPHTTRGGIVFCFMDKGAIQMKGNAGMHIMRAILIATAIAFASIVLSGCVPNDGNPNGTVNAGVPKADRNGKPHRYPVVL